jgi:hypothetical protein
MDSDSTPELRTNIDPIDRAVVVCSVWLHTGYVGAVASAAGLFQLFDPGTSWLAALALAFSGGVLAAASWRQGQAVLEHAERASAVATDALSAVIVQLPRRSPHPRDRAERAIEREARS